MTNQKEAMLVRSKSKKIVYGCSRLEIEKAKGMGTINEGVNDRRSRDCGDCRPVAVITRVYAF